MRMKFLLSLTVLLFSFSAIAAESLPWGGTGAKTAPAAQVQGGKRDEILSKVETYLNQLSTIQADFVQIAPGGNVSTGKFFLKRPGKMRWQYDPPVPVLLISNGSVFTYYDYELQQVNEIPLDDTLAGFIAQETIHFDPKVIKVEEVTNENKVIRVRITQVDHPKDGDLTMEFTDAPIQLRNLILKDGKGEMTNVSLSGARYGVALEEKLFEFKNPNFFNKKRR